jgi:signal transduction histidine kinase
MRRFASDVLSGSSIEFTIRASGPGDVVRVPTELRREVYLIFKEAVNNLVRHSASTLAEIEVSVHDGRLDLRVEDNGVGLDQRYRNDGHGLRSMSERARRIGGEIHFGCAGNGGLRVTLKAPFNTNGGRPEPT